MSSDDKNRRQGDRRKEDRRKDGRRGDDPAPSKPAVGLPVWIFAGVSLLVGLYGGYLLFSVLASGPPPPKKVEKPPPTEEELSLTKPLTIQHRTFRVEIVKGGRTVNALVTPFLELYAKKDKKVVCLRVPQVKAAVTEVLSEERQKNHKNFDTDLEGLTPALTRALNQYLRFKAVKTAHLKIWVNPVKKSRLTEEELKNPRLEIDNKNKIPVCPRPAMGDK